MTQLLDGARSPSQERSCHRPAPDSGVRGRIPHEEAFTAPFSTHKSKRSVRPSCPPAVWTPECARSDLVQAGRGVASGMERKEKKDDAGCIF